MPSQEGGPGIPDLFSESERDTWILTTTDTSVDGPAVLHLDDGGTIADASDDSWTIFPQPEDPYPGAACSSVAVDAVDQLWCGGMAGLHRHVSSVEDPQWILVNQEKPVCDIVPAPDGTLFVQRSDNTCDDPDSSVLIVLPDGAQATMELPDVVNTYFDRISATTGMSSLWSVAPAAAVWYAEGNHGICFLWGLRGGTGGWVSQNGGSR